MHTSTLRHSETIPPLCVACGLFTKQTWLPDVLLETLKSMQLVQVLLSVFFHFFPDNFLRPATVRITLEGPSGFSFGGGGGGWRTAVEGRNWHKTHDMATTRSRLRLRSGVLFVNIRP